jgi:hypothetical protein
MNRSIQAVAALVIVCCVHGISSEWQQIQQFSQQGEDYTWCPMRTHLGIALHICSMLSYHAALTCRCVILTN